MPENDKQPTPPDGLREEYRSLSTDIAALATPVAAVAAPVVNAGPNSTSRRTARRTTPHHRRSSRRTIRPPVHAAGVVLGVRGSGHRVRPDRCRRQRRHGMGHRAEGQAQPRGVPGVPAPRTAQGRTERGPRAWSVQPADSRSRLTRSRGCCEVIDAVEPDWIPEHVRPTLGISKR